MSSRTPLLFLAYTFTTVWLLILSPTSVAGQVYPIPTELSLGAGGVIDARPGQASADVNLGLAWVYVRNGWIEPALEMGLGPTSDVALCQEPEGPLARPETCMDGYVVGGLRFRPSRDSDLLRRPFLHFLLGEYWKGTGLREPDLLPGNFALQAGGGIDIRRPQSIHGLRVSGDYRRVFAGERGRHQFQFIVSYFLGWRGQERTAPHVTH